VPNDPHRASPGQLVVGADIGGNEHMQLLYSDEPGGRWRALTDNPDRIHAFGSFTPDGQSFSFAANTSNPRWFDIFVRDLESSELRWRPGTRFEQSRGAVFADGRWLVVVRSYSNAHRSSGWSTSTAASSRGC